MTRATLFGMLGGLLALNAATPLFAQAPQPVDPVAGLVVLEGAVVSATRSTLVIRSADGEYRLFVLDEDTTRPTRIPERASVAVEAKPASDGTTPIASLVKVTAMPAAPPANATPGVAPAEQLPDEPIPASIRKTEHDIQRQARRFRVGVRAGGTLDPELISLGFHGQLGPFFASNFWARPNLELGFGEVTDLIGLNFEGIYRVPVTARQSRWSFFLGAGPALNFVKLGFAVEDPDTQVNFDDFDLEVGLNVLAGVQSRDGMFVELKATAYSGPHLQFRVGYNF
jgi:hypothetical protein